MGNLLSYLAIMAVWGTSLKGFAGELLLQALLHYNLATQSFLQRMSAVHGGTYVLGRQITSITPVSQDQGVERSRYQIVIDGLETPIHTASVIGTSEKLFPLTTPELRDIPTNPPPELLRGVLILDRPLDLVNSQVLGNQSVSLDTMMVVIPPVVDEGELLASVTFLITGEGSQSAPRGKGKSLELSQMTLHSFI